MAVQTAEQRSLAPWWTAAKCRAHQPYPSRQAAERAADLHPIAFVRCPKCNQGQPIVAFRCHSDPSHHHIGHDLPWSQEDDMASVAAVPTPVVPPRRKTVGSARPPSLTDEQAREIWRQIVVQKRPKNVVSHEFKAKWWTVHQIAEGMTYRSATEALRNGLQETAMPVVDGQITTGYILPERPVVETKRDDDYQAMKDGHAAQEQCVSVYAPRASTIALVTDMADALEVLVQYAGLPLPKFMTLDYAAIQRLIEQARALP